MSVTVRPVTPDEHDAAGRIVRDAYTSVGPMDAAYLDELADTARRIGPGSQVLVAVEDDVVLGTLTVVAATSPHFEHGGHGDGGIRAMAVDPTAQGAGVGSALVDASLVHARELQWRRLVLTSMPWMRGAHRLYMRRGFARRPDLDVRFNSGVGLTFQLDLSDDAPGRFAPPGPVPVTPPRYVPTDVAEVSC